MSSSDTVNLCIRQSLLMLSTAWSCKNCLSAAAKALADARFCSHLRWAELAEERPDTPIFRKIYGGR